MIKIAKLILLKIILILISMASPSLILNEINADQIVHIYKICTLLKDHTDAKYIIIKNPGDAPRKYEIALLINDISNKLKDSSPRNVDDITLFSTNIKKSNYIIKPQLNIFSESNGKRIIKFSCNDIKYFRKKVGPFLIPSTTHLITEPTIELFNYENN